MTRSQLLPCVVLLILSPLLFSSAGRDDSYLTYWPAYELATKGTIQNYNGDYIEQSSTLLHVVTTAAAAWLLPLPIPSIGPILSLCFGCIAVALTYCLARILDARIALPAALTTALSSSLLYWSVSGMESTLAAAALLWFVIESHRWLWTTRGRSATLVASSFAFLSVRPENFLVLASSYAGLAALSRIPRERPAHAEGAASGGRTIGIRRAAVTFLGLNLGVLAGLTAFRMLFFHSAFPQPVYAKAGGLDLHHIVDGVTYFWGNALTRPTAPLWALCALAVARTLRRAPQTTPQTPLEVLLSCFVAAHLGFVVLAGGDWMEAGRFFVPILPIVTVLAFTTLWRSPSAPLRIAATCLLMALQLCDTALLLRSPQNFGQPLWKSLRPRRNDALSWFEHANVLHAGYGDLIPALEHVIDDIGARKPGMVVTVLTGQMGMVPYHVSLNRSKKVRWVDRWGLATRDLTGCRATQDLPRSTRGVTLPYEQFFDRRALIRSVCDFADPDVIFDRAGDRGFETVLTQNGYIVAFQERKRWIQWIAIRRDLADDTMRGPRDSLAMRPS